MYHNNRCHVIVKTISEITTHLMYTLFPVSHQVLNLMAISEVVLSLLGDLSKESM